MCQNMRTVYSFSHPHYAMLGSAGAQGIFAERINETKIHKILPLPLGYYSCPSRSINQVTAKMKKTQYSIKAFKSDSHTAYRIGNSQLKTDTTKK